MNGKRFLKGAAIGLACLGLFMPQGELLAAGFRKKVEKSAQKRTAQKRAAQVTDVALTAGGTLTGKVTNAQGLGIDAALVTLRKGKREVARVITDKKGNFIVKNLRGGVYRIVGGQSEQVFRLWAPKTAPPSALAKASLVSSNKVVRAQLGGLDGVGLLGLGLGITGITLGSIALEKVNSRPYNGANPPVSGP